MPIHFANVIFALSYVFKGGIFALVSFSSECSHKKFFSAALKKVLTGIVMHLVKEISILRIYT